jgi:hypothetical protein
VQGDELLMLSIRYNRDGYTIELYQSAKAVTEGLPALLRSSYRRGF